MHSTRFGRPGGWRWAVARASTLCAISFLIAGAEVGPAAAQQKGPAGSAASVSCSVVMVSMRDGVKLATEVYRPARSGKYPVILVRSPYHSILYSNHLSWAPPSCQ